MITLYPVKFSPILHHRIWGGDKLAKLLNKDSNSNLVGESWEVSNVEANVSVVDNGPLRGKTLRDMISECTSVFLGSKVYNRFGDDFPLLIKFLDASKDLSIQVHPDDELAKKRHHSMGKTEMWYVMQADPGTEITVGFKSNSNQQEYLQHLENKTLERILNREKVRKGDAFFIPAGRIHAIGAGAVIAEIQQTSDITYRIYDYDRTDHKGEKRALHTQWALDAIDYKAKLQYKQTYQKVPNVSNELVECDYFTTRVIPISRSSVARNYSGIDSFVIYICVSGVCTIQVDDFSEILNMGQTILLPACIDKVELMADSAEVLEVYIG